MRRYLLRIAAAALTAAVAPSCSLAEDDEPRSLEREAVPFELLQPEQTSTTKASSAPTVVHRVYLVRDDRLVPALREVEAPVRAAGLLDALLAGPTEAEAAAGLRTAISGEAKVESTSVNGSVLTVDLSEEFLEVTHQEQILALAQIVFTATESPTVAAVRFRLDGELVEVQRGDGSLTSAPLTRADYASLAPA